MTRAGFLERWSARKREDTARAAPLVAPTRDDASAPAQDDLPALTEEAAAQMTDAEALSALRLPDPKDLPHGADFSAFLRAGVPRRLQRMALRRLWAVSPEQAALDGLVDYAEDYTDAAVAVETLATTYEAGRGLRAHTEALARAEQDNARSDDGADDGGDEAAEDGGEASEAQAPALDADSVPQAETEGKSVVAEVPVHNAAEQHEKCAAASSRRASRMTFRFDDA